MQSGGFLSNANKSGLLFPTLRMINSLGKPYRKELNNKDLKWLNSNIL